MMENNARHARGIALVIVLWVVMLLTIIVSSFVYSARAHTKVTANQVARSQAQALADAGVHRGMYELFKPVSDGARWKAEGQTYEFEMAEDKVSVTMVDEAAYIDLNTAQDALLMGLLKSAGIEEGEAQVLLDAILDWRDKDDLVRASGAERDQYVSEGVRARPTNGNFRTVDELKLVLGVSQQLYERVSEALTVYSRQTGINSATASANVLMAIPNVDQEQIDAYLVTRQEEIAAGLPPTAFPPAAAYSATSSGVYNVRSIARMANGTEFNRVAVVRITGDPKRPITFLDWREG